MVFRVPARLLLLTSFSKNVQSGRWCRQPRQKQAGCLPTSGGRTALYFRSALGFSPPKHSQSRKSPWSVFQDGRVEPISSASLVEHGRGPRSGRRPLAVPPALHAVQGARGGGARAAPPKKIISGAHFSRLRPPSAGSSMWRGLYVHTGATRSAPACHPPKANPFSCVPPTDADPLRTEVQGRAQTEAQNARAAAQLAARPQRARH